MSQQERSDVEIKIPFYVTKLGVTGYSGESDDICVMCGMVCTLNSSCSDRYIWYQGSWKGDLDDDEPSILSFCDDCDEKIPAYVDCFLWKSGEVFYVDCRLRAND